ncbi:MAG TPA: DVUA0089 family protein [Phycisphaerales bacterium]|nr:DVUA0089 family protein [Phycisphaerales bacterium]
MRLTGAVLLAVGVGCGMAAAAEASPRETLSFTSAFSDGGEFSPANAVETRTLAGGYGVSKIRVSGTLTAVSPFTYASEAIFKVTPPGAAPFYVQMSGLQDVFTSITFVDVELYLPAPLAQSAGVWEVRFFETYDDGGPDAVWESLSVTLDDEPPGYIEQGDAGSTPATAALPVGSGPMTTIIGSVDGDEDLYRIEVCDPAAFVASTVNGTALDTRLFLFNESGQGVLFNDDYAPTFDEYYFQSRLHNTGTLAAGVYYLGVTVYARMAVDDALMPLWNETPYEEVRSPDGPGAGGALADWSGTPFDGGGDYIVILSGVCYAGLGCGPQDFDGDGDIGTDADIEAFFRCLGGNCCPTCWPGGADFNGDGDIGMDADIEAFFRVLGGSAC